MDVGSLRCLLPGGYTWGVGVSVSEVLPLRPQRRRMVGSLGGRWVLLWCVLNSPEPPSAQT